MGGCVPGTEFQFYRMERVLEVDGGNGCATLWVYLIPLNCNLKIVKLVNFRLCSLYHNFLKWVKKKKKRSP